MMSRPAGTLKADPLWMVLLGIAAGAAVAVALSPYFVGEITAAVASGVALLPPAIANRMEQRRSHVKGVAAFRADPSARPRLLVIALSVGSLLLTLNLMGAIYSILIGLPLWFVVDAAPAGSGLRGLGESEQFQLSWPLTYTVGLITFLPVLYLIIRRTAHYLGPHAYAWTFVVVLSYEVIGTSLEIVVGSFTPDPVAVFLRILLFGVEYGIAMLACFHARRSQAQFVVARSFRKLSEPDRAAVLQLVNDALESLPEADTQESAAHPDDR